MTVSEQQLVLDLRDSPDRPAEVLAVNGGVLTRTIEIGGLVIQASIPISDPGQPDLKGAWWRAYLAGEVAEPVLRANEVLRVADLFCGPGGLALGVRQLCREAGLNMVSEFAVDADSEAVAVYSANHKTRLRSTSSVDALLDYRIRGKGDRARFSYPPTIVEEAIAEAAQGVDLVLAGPPCQGHSNLNNRSRRDDRRNGLYLTVPAFAVATGARMAIIENVPSVVHDHSSVVETARYLFSSNGYEVVEGVLGADRMGWPQSRRRHFMVARRDRSPLPLAEVEAALADDARSLWWVIGELEDRIGGSDVMEQVTELSPENQARVDWLFDNDAYDLDLAERPESHRNGTTYTSVYGRLRRDEPAPTITTGFMSPGRGRYVHPTRRRVLTPREAARIQGFPDTYRFVVDPSAPPTRAKLAKWIGDAVPMPLGYAAALSALGPGL